MLMKAVLLRSILTLSLTAFASSQSVADTFTVFAAASLKNAIDEIADLYEAQSSETVVVSYAGSATLARQIEMGAPADVFISANTAWMDYLSERALIDEPSRFNLASNQLVLISSRPNLEFTLDDPQELIKFLENEYLAMGMVESVPAGIYGKQALTSYHLWDALNRQVAQADNVRSALALVASARPLWVSSTNPMPLQKRMSPLPLAFQSYHMTPLCIQLPTLKRATNRLAHCYSFCARSSLRRY